MPSPVRFAVVKKLLEGKGYYLSHTNGSHHIFKKAGEMPQSVPVHNGLVKHVYFKKAQKAP